MKAKDLLNKNTDDAELDEVHELPDPEEDAPKKKSHEDDKVTAAYEEINRKLSALRSGKPAEDEDESDPKPKESDEDEAEGEEEEEDPKPSNLEAEEEDPLDSEVPVVDKESDDEEDEELDPVDKLEKEDLKGEGAEGSNGTDNDKPTDEAPRKTFEPESNPEVPRQFRTSNIHLDEEEIPQKSTDEPFDSLDDLAQSDDKPAQNPQYSEMNSNAPRGEADDGTEIPPLNAPRQQYNFSQAGSPPANSSNQANSDMGSRGYSQRRNHNSFGSEFQHRSRSKSSAIFQLLILLLIGAGVIGGTVYFLKNQFGTTSTTASPSPSANSQIAIPEVSPTPTPIPVDRTQFKIRVLNGTDKTGLAGTVADKLKGLGYGIDRTGNATNSAFEKTIIRVKENDSSLSGQLLQDLSPDYTPDVQVTLKSTDTIDSEIILGEK